MAYTQQKRKEIVEQVRQGTKISVVAGKYNVSPGTIRTWMRYPERYFSKIRAPHTPHAVEEKVRVIQRIEAGERTVKEISEEQGISLRLIYNWREDKDRILALYSSQEQTSVKTDKAKSSGEEVPIVSKPDNKDEKQYNRSLKEENEFLKAKVAYLEAVMELNGIPLSELKKKRSTRPSTKSSETESDR